MWIRNRGASRFAAGGLPGVALVPLALIALGACQSDPMKSSQGSNKPKTEQDPAIGSTLPEGPSVAMNAAANDAARSFPLDAAPSPDGKSVYYTAVSDNGNGDKLAGIFTVSADGGDVTALTSGDPLAAPVGVTVSADGATLFVADPGAGNGGAILTAPTAGGIAAILAGTEGYRPQGVVLADLKKPTKQTRLFFTGIDPTSGDAGLFDVDPAGGTVTAVATGSPFGEPGGVVVLASGDAFVADGMTTGGVAGVVKVSDGTASVFVDRIGVGFPAGITTTMDESTLIVSGLDPATRTDIVYFVGVESKELSALTQTIGAFHEPAGLHRAHDTDVFAWADSRANDTGTVYVLRP
jgi:hypothetical protein